MTPSQRHLSSEEVTRQPAGLYLDLHSGQACGYLWGSGSQLVLPSKVQPLPHAQRPTGVAVGLTEAGSEESVQKPEPSLQQTSLAPHVQRRSSCGPVNEQASLGWPCSWAAKCVTGNSELSLAWKPIVWQHAPASRTGAFLWQGVAGAEGGAGSRCEGL